MKEMLGIMKLGRKERGFVPIFLISLALSMLFMVLNRSELLLQSDVLSESTLSLVNSRVGNNDSLFLYVLRERVWIIPVLFLFSTTYLAPISVYGMIIWYGVSWGTILAITMLRYKVLGVLFLMVCGFPQYLLYIPAVFVALRLSGEQRTPDKRFFVQLIVLESMVFVGCLLESFINSLFIEKIIKIFIGV